MSNKPSWMSGIKKIQGILDEDSVEFKKELNRRNLEKDSIKFTYNNKLSASYFFRQSTQNKECYFIIDKGIYESTKTILQKEGIEHVLDDVCTLLKQTYYKSILISINSEKNKVKNRFNRDFSDLVKILDKNIVSIKVHTNVKEKEFKTSNQELINLILSAFRDKIKNHLILVAELLVDADLETDSFNELSPTLESDLIFNLILCIHTKTDYKYNSPEDSIKSKKIITNRLCDLVYELVGTIKTFSDNYRSPSRIVIRNKFKRYTEKHPSLLVLFDKRFDKEKDLMMFYPEDKYIQLYLDNTNLINLLK